jgi:hypothetical protein
MLNISLDMQLLQSRGPKLAQDLWWNIPMNSEDLKAFEIYCQLENFAV